MIGTGLGPVKPPPSAAGRVAEASDVPGAMSWPARVAALLAALSFAATAPWAILVAVNSASPEPERAFHRDRCTRACHDHGCRHAPVLPPALTSDQGLFGAAVRALHVAGGATGLGRARGYGAANIAIFCVLWPLLMLALVGVVIWQGLALAARRRALRGAGP